MSNPAVERTFEAVRAATAAYEADDSLKGLNLRSEADNLIYTLMQARTFSDAELKKLDTLTRALNAAHQACEDRMVSRARGEDQDDEQPDPADVEPEGEDWSSE